MILVVRFEHSHPLASDPDSEYAMMLLPDQSDPPRNGWLRSPQDPGCI